MEGKPTSILTVFVLGLLLESLPAAIPFGRLMPLHYGADDIRTIVMQRVESEPLLSLPLDNFPELRLSTASTAEPGVGTLSASNGIRSF
jgi:hypothetical protein